jgi:hypothetical protein
MPLGPKDMDDLVLRETAANLDSSRLRASNRKGRVAASAG